MSLAVWPFTGPIGGTVAPCRRRKDGTEREGWETREEQVGCRLPQAIDGPAGAVHPRPEEDHRGLRQGHGSAKRRWQKG